MKYGTDTVDPSQPGRFTVPLSRKKQIQDLRQQLETMRSEISATQARREEHDSRIANVEGIIEGHDATLEVTGKMLEDLSSAGSAVSAEQFSDLARTTTAALSELRGSLDGQQATISTQDATIADQHAVIDALRARLEELEATSAAESARIQARLGEITEQLLHQLDELGNEVEAAGTRADIAVKEAAAPKEFLGTLQAVQVKLAAEQVRYDLALRAEFAELADRVRRGARG